MLIEAVVAHSSSMAKFEANLTFDIVEPSTALFATTTTNSTMAVVAHSSNIAKFEVNLTLDIVEPAKAMFAMTTANSTIAPRNWALRHCYLVLASPNTHPEEQRELLGGGGSTSLFVL